MQLMSRFAVPLALLLLVLAAPVTAQAPSPTTTDATPPSRHPEEGKPFIRNYPPDVYGGGGQNWGMVQDARGVIYIGGSRGVLEYDGVSWRLIATPTQTVVRSVALGSRRTRLRRVGRRLRLSGGGPNRPPGVQVAQKSDPEGRTRIQRRLANLRHAGGRVPSKANWRSSAMRTAPFASGSRRCASVERHTSTASSFSASPVTG